MSPPAGGSDRPAWHSCCFTTRGAMRVWTMPEIWWFWKTRTAADGIAGRLPKRCRWSGRRLRWRPGPFAVQAAIAAEHCRAARARRYRLAANPALYDVLERAAALAHRLPEPRGCRSHGHGPGRRSSSSMRSLSEAIWTNYHLLHSARADLLRRAGSPARRRKATGERSELVTNDSERLFLERRLREVEVG